MLNLRFLEESWLELIKRHPSLRSEFTAKEGATSFKDYKLKIDNNKALPEIEVKDLSNLPEEIKSKTIKQVIEDILNEKFIFFISICLYIFF
jgi:hypothetical protein